jgi:penicillin amidase
MRTQIDFGDPNSIQIINPLGESGHRLSPHFQDQADLYARGEFRTLSLEKMKTSDKNRTTILSSKKKE